MGQQLVLVLLGNCKGLLVEDLLALLACGITMAPGPLLLHIVRGLQLMLPPLT